MTTYIQYEHHGNRVWVREDLEGTHRANCLCYSCDAFKPDSPDNCPIAQALYNLDVMFGLVTPVYECPEFVPVLRDAEHEEIVAAIESEKIG